MASSEVKPALASTGISSCNPSKSPQPLPGAAHMCWRFLFQELLWEVGREQHSHNPCSIPSCLGFIPHLPHVPGNASHEEAAGKELWNGAQRGAAGQGWHQPRCQSGLQTQNLLCSSGDLQLFLSIIFFFSQQILQRHPDIPKSKLPSRPC